MRKGLTPTRDATEQATCSCRFQQTAAVIPAYNPDATLRSIVRRLADFGFARIIVVNDGSDKESTQVFRDLSAEANITLLEHEKNLGKGAALKTAFRFVTTMMSDEIRNVITVDADGQHTPEDVLTMAHKSQEYPNQLILGIRNFSGSVPFRSRFGNTLTNHVLYATEKINLRDTQTGLRSLPSGMLRASLELSSDRYEFELECLLLANRMGVRIVQMPIKTIYVNDNRASHFRPIVDSMRIYFVFLRFVLVSVASFGIDLGAFILIYWFSSNIIASTYLARLISGSFNFTCNKSLVFRSLQRKRVVGEGLAYIALAVLIASLSALGVTLLSTNRGLGIITATKVTVDVFLFLLSFLVQKLAVFRCR